MLKCDQPERPKKTYTIPKVSKKRQAAIDARTWQPKPKQAIKQRSDKRAEQERQYITLASQFKKDNPICQRCKVGKTSDVHHSKGRLGKLLTDIKHFIALCRQCHLWVEQNPSAAYAEGMSKSRLTN